MGQGEAREIAVYRARPADCGRIAEFLSRTLPGRRTITRDDVLRHLGRAGLLLAEREGEPVGLLGFQVENLVARVTDFWVVRPHERVAIAQALLAAMEETAHELQCEAALLLMPTPPSVEMAAFWEGFGYRQRPAAELPRPWRDAAGEAPLGPDGTVLVKQLRRERVLRPI